MKKYITYLLILLASVLNAQEDCAKYKTDYIPKDLNDAISYLDCNWSEEDKLAFANKNESEAVAELHFGTGRAIRNNWGLWKGDSKLSKYFNRIGIFHPDDMSSIILRSYHRYLNSKDFKLEEQVKYYEDYWKKAEKTETERKQSELNEFKVADTVEFAYSFGFVSKQQERKWFNDKCLAKGIVQEIDTATMDLLIQLIESCDKKGVIVYEYTEKEKNDGIKIMKTGDIEWTPFDYWYTIE